MVRVAGEVVVGKFDKKVLRARLADGDLEVERINSLLTLPRCGWSIVGIRLRKGELMRSGMFRRRKAAVVTVLVAGSALGSGLPVLMSQNPNYSAEAAVATITLSVTSIPGVTGPVNVTFAKLGGITYDVGAPQPSPTCTNCKPAVTVIPPTITLREPFAASIATYQDMLAWERAMRAGLPTGRENATLTLASSTGTTIGTYTLENAYPTNVDVAAGDPQSVSFSVTLTGDELILASPGG